MERWLPVVGFEGAYEVSDLGNVRSLDRDRLYISKTGGVSSARLKGRVLRPAINTKRGGYRYVNMRVDGQQTLRRVAVLVAEAFIGPRPEGLETCHNDGVALNDRGGNLRYDTPKNNTADKIAHGTHQRGEAVSTARLTEEIVRVIKYGRAPADVLAARYDVHPGHINNIRRGVRWAHVCR